MVGIPPLAGLGLRTLGFFLIKRAGLYPRPEKSLPKELEIEQDGKPPANIPLVAGIIPIKGIHEYPIVEYPPIPR